MIYPKNFEDKIDFTAIRKLLKEKCLCELGAQCCDKMRFCSDYDAVLTMLAQTSELVSVLSSGTEFPADDYIDITSAIARVRAMGAYMLENELYALRRSLVTISAISRFFASDAAENCPKLRELVEPMPTFPEVVDAIGRVLDKFGNIRDDASPELLAIKRQIASTTASVNGLLRRVISQGRAEGYIDKDASPSVRDGRLVIPVAPMNKRRLRGIVHDESATGRTVYIEPAEIVEANNTIRELEGEMRREIVRILTAVSDQIRPLADDMLAAYAVMGQIDFIRAKAIFAAQIDASMPHIEPEPQIDWYHAVHPTLLLSLTSQGKEVVPLNINLGDKERILIISGPNAGGKSVCLKTVSVVQYMTQCGLLPPVYSNSHVGIFRNIFVDIGDEQSIENDLSTYSSHLTNMKTILGRGDGASLVLIDEFGGGTDPQIGGAIAQAILARMNEKGVFGVITTHYQNLKHFAEDTPGIVNGAMLYDRQQMRPLFQLSIGYPGSSFAVEIARKIGLPADVISEAERIAGSDYINIDKYLLDIARDRRYWESKRMDVRGKEKRLEALIEQYENEIGELNGQRKQIIKAAKEEAKEIINRSNATIERTISDIKTAQAERERTKEARRRIDELKANLESDGGGSADVELRPKLRRPKKRRKTTQVPAAANVALEPIVEGDYVTLDGGNSPLKVLELDGKEAVVAIGDFSSRVAVSRLRKTRRPAAPAATVATVTSATAEDIRRRQLKFKQEIDVRGFRADEAVQAVMYFIDDALQFNAKTVRILHGTGNGILRDRIREYLNTVGGVSSYRDEHVQLGGAGITVVEL